MMLTSYLHHSLIRAAAFSLFCSIIVSNDIHEHSHLHKHHSHNFHNNHTRLNRTQPFNMHCIPAECDPHLDMKRMDPKERKVVDILVTVLEGKDDSYIRDGKFWSILSVILLLSQNDDNSYNTRIHIISDATYALMQGLKFGEPFYIHDLKSHKFSKHFNTTMEDFYKVYAQTHRSVNKLDYEFMCFNRWNIYRLVMEKWNKVHNDEFSMHRIITIDLDVLFLIDPAVFFDNALSALSPNSHPGMHGSRDDFELIVVALGALHMWSPRGLVNFSDFILNWYNRPIDDILAANSKYERWFSDMMIATEFITENNVTRNGCFEYRRASGFQVWGEEVWDQERQGQIDCLFHRLGCIPLNDMNAQKHRFQEGSVAFYEHGKVLADWNVTAEGKGDRETKEEAGGSGIGDSAGQGTPGSASPLLYLKSAHEDLPYCMMHFQGEGQNKQHLVAFARAVEIALAHRLRLKERQRAAEGAVPARGDEGGEEGAGIAPAPYSFLIGRQGSKSIEYISPLGVRHHVPTWDVLTSLGLQSKMVFHTFAELVNFFPEGPDLHEDTKIEMPFR